MEFFIMWSNKMPENLYNHIHEDSMTSEMAVIDNIARELQSLNNTMKEVRQALQLIALKLPDLKKQD